MWRWIRRIVAGLFAFVILGAIGGATYQWVATRRDLSQAAPGRLVDVGGFRLHIWCKGSGTPAVILDAGLGDTAFIWNLVRDGVAEFTQACAYDRAGEGYSDPGPSPRTSVQMARELVELLPRAGIRDPAILVGASFGGLNVRIVASEYPQRAAGLVLVDASHENQRLDMPRFASLVPMAGSLGVLRLLGVSLGRNPELEPPAVRSFQRAVSFRTGRYRTLFDQLTHIPQSAAQVRASRRELAIPLVVVTSGRNNENLEWRAFQQDQVRLSKRACQVIAAGSGHVVARDKPEVVIEAIRSTWTVAQTGGSPVCD